MTDRGPGSAHAVPQRSAPARPRGLRDAYCGELRAADSGTRVSVCGWVARRREHGEHLAFLDVRDHTGIVQCVVDGGHELRAEYVVRVTGEVRRRPEGTVNDSLPTGEIEIGADDVEVLAASETPPFSLDGRTETDEAVRLRFRYVDLRSVRMQANLRTRAVVNAAIRRSMERQGFVEVETPLLWTPTPEGAREFAVPSRLQPGSFYVLPQSPQIAKQLLMVSGFDRYYQIARCMRDEDLRADRQFEFTQLDMEASFVAQEDVWEMAADSVLEAARDVTGSEPPPVERMTWAEAQERYGTDKPDLRFQMEIIPLEDAVAGSGFNAFNEKAVRAIVLAGGASLARSRLDALTDRAKALGAGGLVWLRAVAGAGGLDLESPVSKFLTDAERGAIVEATGCGEGDLVLATAGNLAVVLRVLGQLRLELGQPPASASPLRFVWVTDFPLFEGLDDNGNPVAAHHPFTMPNLDDIDRLESDPLSVRSHSYDLVLNGWELGSGSIRIHRGDIQRRVFTVLGISPEEAESRFGFLLGAFRYGAPPHGGFAYGIDRLAALLAGEENIREVIAFPKTQSGADLMAMSPRELPGRQLEELGLRVVKKAAS